MDSVENPWDMTVRAWWHALRDAAKAFQARSLTDNAAALTYYSVLSIFPGLIVLVSLLGVVGSESSIEGLLRIADDLGSSSAVDTLRSPIENIVNGSSSAAGTALVIGVLAALWSASGYIGAFIRTANEIHDVEEERPFYKLRPLQLLMTLVMTIAVAVILIALVLTGPLATAIGEEIGLGDEALAIWSIAKWPLLFVAVVCVIGLLYRFSPDTRSEGLRWVLPGSLVATVLWLVASAGFSFYVANFGSYSSTYGSLAGGIVLLLWLWLTNVAVVFGAQFATELERTANAARVATPPGGPVPIDPDERPGRPAGPRQSRRRCPASSSRAADDQPWTRERNGSSGPLITLGSMSGQGQIEALQAPLDASPVAVPLVRTFVRDLAEGDAVAGAFAVRERERRSRKSGEDWVKLIVADRTGTVEAVAWEDAEECFERAAPGTVVFIDGKFSVHPQYGAKITIRSIRPADEEEFTHEELAEGPPVSVEQLEAGLRELLGTIQNPQLQQLLQRIFGDESEIWKRFRVAPAAKYYHQAYPHGLLDHTVSVASAVSAAAAAFPGIDRDVAITGALLHDIGKTQAYNDDPLAIDLTDAGRLLGEIPLGYYLVRRTIESIEGFDRELAKAVLHIILSHHGKLENGSPVVPATREATLVHAMDNLGGTLGSFDRIERELPDGQAWSRFDRGIDSAAYFRSRAA